MAIEQYAWAPSSGTVPNDVNNGDDDEYLLSLNSIVADMEESFRDNKDVSVRWSHR